MSSPNHEKLYPRKLPTVWYVDLIKELINNENWHNYAPNARDLGNIAGYYASIMLDVFCPYYYYADIV